MGIWLMGQLGGAAFDHTIKQLQRAENDTCKALNLERLLCHNYSLLRVLPTDTAPPRRFRTVSTLRHTASTASATEPWHSLRPTKAATTILQEMVPPMHCKLVRLCSYLLLHRGFVSSRLIAEPVMRKVAPLNIVQSGQCRLAASSCVEARRPPNATF